MANFAYWLATLLLRTSIRVDCRALFDVVLRFIEDEAFLAELRKRKP